jgi:acyl carrier protein
MFSVERLMQGPLDPRSFESTQRWLVSWMAAELDLEAEAIDADQTFLSYGMDSMHAMMLAGDLEAALGTRLAPTLVWDYPTIKALGEFVVNEAYRENQKGDLARPAVSNGRMPAESADPRALLAQLDGMSEEDMDLLLGEYLKTTK